MATIETPKKHSIKTLLPSPVYDTLLCVCEDELTLWNMSDYSLMTNLSGIDLVGLVDACFTHDGKHLIALLKIHHIVVWNMDHMALILDLNIPEEYISTPFIGISLSSDDRYLVVYNQ